MPEPTNAVLSEQIKQLKKDFFEEKKQTRDNLKELEKDFDSNRRVTNELNFNMNYVKETVSDMKDMINGFIGVSNEQNKRIDEFINSDSQKSQKQKLLMSTFQVLGGIVLAILGFLGYGQL